jgi:V/A-type H+-transporting ATPase subunit K
MAALALGCIGASYGVAITGPQGIGVLTERPELFGKVFLLTLLPSTQGLYGLVFAFLVASSIGLISGPEVAYTLTPVAGFAIMLVGIMVGLVQMLSSICQAKVIAAGIAMVGRQEDKFGWAIVIQALVETFSVFGLLMGILLLNWLVKSGATLAAVGGV